MNANSAVCLAAIPIVLEVAGGVLWALGLVAAAFLAVALVVRTAASGQTETADLFCLCHELWTPLDVRWRSVLAMVEGMCVALGPAEPAGPAGPAVIDLTYVSALISVVGDFLAWFGGARHLRVPGDALYYDHIARNYRTAGCILGEEALVEVSAEKWCPSRAALHRATEAARI